MSNWLREAISDGRTGLASAKRIALLMAALSMKSARSPAKWVFFPGFTDPDCLHVDRPRC